MSYRAGSRTGGKRRDTHRSPWYKETMDKAPKQTLKPTPEYLKLVSSADILNTGEDGTTTPPPRKLFILSLGSTLTLRNGKRDAPLLRAYLPVFMRYVTHSETKTWADVIVWSAAAKRNVEPQVKKILSKIEGGSGGGLFGSPGLPHRTTTGGNESAFWEKHLFDVWCQETIARLKGEENKPVVHTPLPKPKDLSLAWSTSSFSHRTSDNPDSNSGGHAHSAYTTLLIDDSPTADCVPQHPYNHLRVAMFDEDVRSHDTSIKETFSDGPLSGSSVRKAVVLDEDGLPDLGRLSLSEEKKVVSATNGQGLEWVDPGYDITLLAVIGILEEMKEQRSVVAWVRNEGLWGGAKAPNEKKETKAVTPADVNNESDESKVATGSADGSTNDQNDPKQISIAVGNGGPSGTLSPTKAWFQDAENLRYWAVRGRAVCTRLGIDPDEHGVERI